MHLNKKDYLNDHILLLWKITSMYITYDINAQLYAQTARKFKPPNYLKCDGTLKCDGHVKVRWSTLKYDGVSR